MPIVCATRRRSSAEHGTRASSSWSRVAKSTASRPCTPASSAPTRSRRRRRCPPSRPARRSRSWRRRSPTCTGSASSTVASTRPTSCWARGADRCCAGSPVAGSDGEVAPDGPGPIAEFRDPAAAAGAPLSSTVDVYALGTLLRVLLVGDGADLEPIPERRFVFRRGRPWNGYLRRALLTLADQCTDEQPLRRPAAGRLAADVEALLPRAGEATSASTRGRVDVVDDDDRSRRRPPGGSRSLRPSSDSC